MIAYDTDFKANVLGSGLKHWIGGGDHCLLHNNGKEHIVKSSHNKRKIHNGK